LNFEEKKKKQNIKNIAYGLTVFAAADGKNAQ
jgi:hypothetical protein